MVDMELLLDEFENFGHELELVKLFKVLQQYEKEHCQAINKSVIKSVIVEPSLTIA